MSGPAVASPPWVIVTDVETRAALAAIRGLAAAGNPVAAVAGRFLAMGHWSRACKERHVGPHPLEDEEGFIARLEHIVCGRPGGVLLPGSDASLRAVSKHRSRLEGAATIALPPHEVVMRTLDKVAVSDAAAECGLPYPPTVLCASLDEALQAANNFGFPVLLKPREVVVGVDGTLRRPASLMMVDAEALARRLPRLGGSCLVQPHVPGSIVSYAGVVNDGRLLGHAVSVYRRTWPPQAGSVAFSETTIQPSSALHDRVKALLARLEWRGIFELELIARERGGFNAIDFNPRVYGSLALAIGAGANLPVIWSRCALGERPEPASARPGVYFRREDADLRTVLWHARAGRFRRAAGTYRPRRNVVHALLQARDPGPGVAWAVVEARAALARLRGGR